MARSESKPSLAILAPSPILTVTIEAGDERGPEIHYHAGGQGVWVARMAAALGGNVVLCAALAGEAGEVLEALLPSPGVELRRVDGSGRTGSYVHDRRSGERVEVASTVGPTLRRHQADELYGAMLTAGLEAGTALLTGPQPPDALGGDFYRRLAADLRHNGATVLADLSDGALDGALAGGVDLLKVSHEELLDAGLAASAARDELLARIPGLSRRGAAGVVVSRAGEPALALIADRLYELSGPRFEPSDPTGAGDSMFAGIGVATAGGRSRLDALRLGIAAGALNVTRRGLGTGHPAEVERLLAQVDVRELDGRIERR